MDDVIQMGNNNKNHKKIIIILVTMAVFFIAILVSLAVRKGGDQQPKEENTSATTGSAAKTWSGESSSSSSEEAGSLVKGTEVRATTAPEAQLSDPSHNFTDKDIDNVISSKKLQKKLNKVIESEAYEVNSKISKIAQTANTWPSNPKNQKYAIIYSTISNVIKPLPKEHDVEFMGNTYGFTKNYFIAYNFYYYHPGYDLYKIGPATEDSPMQVNDKTDDTYYVSALNSWAKDKASKKDPIVSIAEDGIVQNKDTASGQTDTERKQAISSLYDNNKEIYGKVKRNNIYLYPEVGKLYHTYFLTLKRAAFVKSNAYKFDGCKSTYVDIRKGNKCTYVICLTGKGRVIGVVKK